MAHWVRLQNLNTNTDEYLNLDAVQRVRFVGDVTQVFMSAGIADYPGENGKRIKDIVTGIHTNQSAPKMARPAVPVPKSPKQEGPQSAG